MRQVLDHAATAGDEHRVPEVDGPVGRQLVETRLLVPGSEVLVGSLVHGRDGRAEHLHPRHGAQVRRVVLPAQRGEHPLDRAIDPGDAERSLFEAQVEEVERRGAPPHDDHVLAGELGGVAQRRRVILGQRRASRPASLAYLRLMMPPIPPPTMIRSCCASGRLSLISWCYSLQRARISMSRTSVLVVPMFSPVWVCAGIHITSPGRKLRSVTVPLGKMSLRRNAESA